MTDYYVRSTDGSDSDNGSTWALAKATLAGAAAVASAGDRIFVSQNHSETISFSATTTVTFPENCIVACVDDTSGEPPTALATGALIAINCTAASGFFQYNYGGTTNPPSWHGITFEPSRVSNVATAYVYINGVLFSECVTGDKGSGAYDASGGGFSFPGTRHSPRNRKNGTHGMDGQPPSVVGVGSKALSNASGSAISETNRGLAYGLDFSALSDQSYLLQNDASVRSTIFEPPATFTGSISQFIGSNGNRGFVYGFDSMFASRASCDQGFVYYDSGVYRSGGAEFSSTPFSLRYESDASYASWAVPLLTVSSPIVLWNDGTSQITVAVEIAHNAQGSGASGAFTDREAYLLVAYPDHATKVTYELAGDQCGMLASASDQPTSSETWVNAAGYVKQTLSVTFTPARAGWLFVHPCLAKPSATMYVDPKATVT